MITFIYSIVFCLVVLGLLGLCLAPEQGPDPIAMDAILRAQLAAHLTPCAACGRECTCR